MRPQTTCAPPLCYPMSWGFKSLFSGMAGAHNTPAYMSYDVDLISRRQPACHVPGTLHNTVVSFHTECPAGSHYNPGNLFTTAHRWGRPQGPGQASFSAPLQPL